MFLKHSGRVQATPIWGSGGFEVANGAELSLSNLLLSETASITFGGNGRYIVYLSCISEIAWLRQANV